MIKYNELQTKYSEAPGFLPYHSFRFAKSLPWYEIDEDILGSETLAFELLVATTVGTKVDNLVGKFNDTFCEQIGHSYENDDVPDAVEESYEQTFQQFVYRHQLGQFEGWSQKRYRKEFFDYAVDAGATYADCLMLDYGDWLADA